jgi:hypothetical protein
VFYNLKKMYFRYLYDAKWQNPFHSAKKITRVLEGKHKPIYHPMNDTGDHVVVINSRHVALLGREWQFRVYFHHPGNISSTDMQHNWITISLMWIIFNSLKKAKLEQKICFGFGKNLFNLTSNFC